MISKNFMWIRNVFATLLFSVTFYSCTHIGLFEKQEVVPSQEWYYDFVPAFTFEITDTTALYNVYLTIRHTDLYEYNNLWVKVGKQFPGADSLTYQNINLKLGSDDKGWFGTGMGDIFEVRTPITPGPVSFKNAGKYTFTIAQIMRENPLKYILNVGLRLEKAER